MDTDVESPEIGGKERMLRAVLSALAAQRGGARLSAGLAGDAAPASLTQQQLWLLEQLEPGEPVNNLCVAYRLRGRLSVERLRVALEQAVARHAALRTRFELDGARLLQRAQPPCALALKIETLREVPQYVPAASDDPSLPARAEAWAKAQARLPFADGEVPLFRPALLEIGPEDHLLVLTVHHLAFDGWSFDILMREVCASYAGSATPPWPVDAPCYADYAAWQRDRLITPSAAAAREFWTRQLRDAPPPVRLAGDARGRASLIRPGARHGFVIGDELAEAVEALAERNGSTGFMVYLTAYLAMLHRRTSAEDVVVGCPIANRCLGETRDVIGPFAQMFPIRASITGADRFDGLLKRVRDTVLGAYVHQNYPLSAMVEGSGPGGYPGGAVQCNFAYQNVPRSGWSLSDLEVEAWDVGNGCASGDLALFVWQDATGMQAYIEYDCERFEAATIAAFAEQYRCLLRSATRAQHTAVGALNLGANDPAERQRLYEWGQGRGRLAPASAVHEAFHAQARATPDAVALIAGERRLSYARLDRASDTVARRLLSRWLQPATPTCADASVIAFKLPGSLERLVLLLAILKAGAAYLPLKSDAPQAYADELLAEAGSVCVVVEDAAAWPGTIEACSLSELFDGVQLDSDVLDRAADDAIALPSVGPAGLACLMYTSGSTGRAKGVRIVHRGIVALTQSPSYLPSIERETFLQLAPIAFDASSFEIWGALLNGGCLVLPTSDKPSLGEIAATIATHDVGVLWLSSGLFQVLLEAHPQALARLRLLLVGGDVVSVEHVRRYLAMPRHGLLYNGYGPTENTTFTTAHAIDAEPVDPSTGVSIGRPIAGDCLRVLDTAGQPVPVGVVGEACVGGVGLMLGYQRSDSDRHWIADPFTVPGERLYRTGDAVRWRGDGCLDFIGRLDQQLKLRGFRIEPAQVEAELNRSERVRACAVGAREHEGRAAELIAAVVPTDAAAEPTALIAELRGFLERRLPDYLIPSRMAIVPELPLTANGKTDRRALARLIVDAPQQATTACAPRNNDEAVIHAAFARALGHERFGVHDDFFTAGGDSLAALLLLSRLEQELRARVSLADLFESRTVAALAARLDRDVTPSRVRDLPEGLVEIKHGDDRVAPMFLMPGGKGGRVEMTLYAELMRHIGGHAAGYGFITQPPGGRPLALTERARIYVERMRAVQPQGPYCLIGECIGGLAAFEMAQQLRHDGQQVALLLIDTWCPSRIGTLHYHLIQRPQVVVHGAIEETRDYLKQSLGAAKQVGYHALVRRLPGIAWRGTGLAAGLLLRMLRPERARADDAHDADFDYIRQAMAYRPQVYPGDALLLASEGNREHGIAESWRRLVRGEFRLQWVPGDHRSYLREDVASTAQALRSLLEYAAPDTMVVPMEDARRSSSVHAESARPTQSGVRI